MLFSCFQIASQRLGNHLADRLLALPGALPDLVRQASGKLDRKDRLGDGNRQRDRLALSQSQITKSLTPRDSIARDQRGHNLRRRGFVAHQLDSHVHTLNLFGGGRLAHIDIKILPYTSPRQVRLLSFFRSIDFRFSGKSRENMNFSFVYEASARPLAECLSQSDSILCRFPSRLV